MYDTDSLDNLKSDLVVTANFADSTTQAVTGYTLSGTLAEGTSTITVSYGGKTTTFNVTVSGIPISDETHWADGVRYTYDLIADAYINERDGSIVNYNSWSMTPKLYCNGASTITITCLADNGVLTAGNGKYNAFYDANNQFVSSFTMGALLTKDAFIDIDVPSNASYFAVSHKTQGISYIAITPNA